MQKKEGGGAFNRALCPQSQNHLKKNGKKIIKSKVKVEHIFNIFLKFGATTGVYRKAFQTLQLQPWVRCFAKNSKKYSASVYVV